MNNPVNNSRPGLRAIVISLLLAWLLMSVGSWALAGNHWFWAAWYYFLGLAFSQPFTEYLKSLKLHGK